MTVGHSLSQKKRKKLLYPNQLKIAKECDSLQPKNDFLFPKFTGVGTPGPMSPSGHSVK